VVTQKEIEKLSHLLELLRNEIDWAERAGKPLPPDLAEGNEEAWRARCEEGKKRVPSLRKKAKALIDSIDWTK